MDSQIAIIFTCVAIFVLWVFYFWFYWQYRIEKTRQELFFIRNELFDYAAAGNISFNHPAYSLLREMMNSMIRFTHKVELFTLICLFIALRNSQPEKGRYEIFKKELETLPVKIKEEFKKYVSYMNMVIVSHLIKGSILLMGFTLIVGLFILVRQGWKNLKDEIKKRFPGIEQIDKIAAELG
jgi:hypothetical protein